MPPGRRRTAPRLDVETPSAISDVFVRSRTPSVGARGCLRTYNNVRTITNARTPSNFTHRLWRPRVMYILNNRINHETNDVRLFLTRSARVVPNYSTRFATADDVASQCTQCLLFILSRASVLYHRQTLLVPCVISIFFSG